MKLNRVRSIIILGSISIIGIIIFQVYWVYRTFNTIDDAFNQSVKIALLNVARDLAEFNKSEIPNENPVVQISYNYFVVDVNNIIEPNILEHYLKTRFSHSNIDLDFEYAIYDCYSDEMTYGNYVQMDTINREKSGLSEFKKVDEYLYYFGVSFPGKTVYLLSGTNLWFVSGLVLISALVFFSYATYELLRQKKLSEIQKEFINNITHEFKTPISTIGISSKVLNDPSIIENPDRLLKYSEIIMLQNKRLEEKIEQILQIGLLEKSRVDLQFESIPLSQFLKDIIDNFTIKLEEVEGSIQLITANEELHIAADKFHFSNIIFNLLDNAAKYCTEKPDIQLCVRESEKTIEISVKDNGIGIDPKYRKKIFQKFFRIPTGDIHNVKGFGIGLSYVKQIISLHSWKIAVNNNPDRGSTFIISIPKHQNR